MSPRTRGIFFARREPGDTRAESPPRQFGKERHKAVLQKDMPSVLPPPANYWNTSET
jgi:hypothetical protein